MRTRGGIFASLRRRRWALSLALGYALLVNALLGTSVEAAMAAADSNPLLAVAATPLCGPGDSAPADPHHHPADHQQSCPLCGPACPMGGCAPLQSAGATLAFAAPREAVLAVIDRGREATIFARSLYASDTDSQGPPAA